MQVGGSGEGVIGNQEMRKSKTDESFALDGSYDSDDELDLKDFDDDASEMEDADEDDHDNGDGQDSSGTTASKHIAATIAQTTNTASSTVNDHDLEQLDVRSLRTKIGALAYQTENLMFGDNFEDFPTEKEPDVVTEGLHHLFESLKAPEGVTQAKSGEAH